MSSSAKLVVEAGPVPLDAVSAALAGAAEVQGAGFVEEQASDRESSQRDVCQGFWLNPKCVCSRWRKGNSSPLVPTFA